MTKYFHKWKKIKIYIIGYPLRGNMKNYVILGHVDFFEIIWISLIVTYFII